VTTAPIQEHPEVPHRTASGRNIFEDPAIQEAAKNDAFARFVFKNWRSLLMTLVAVGACMIGYSTYTTTALNKRAAATTRLADIQDSYKTLTDMQDDLAKQRSDLASAKEDAQKATLTTAIEKRTKEIEEARGKLSLVIDSLDPSEPFGTLGQLYRGLLAGRFNDFEGVTKAIAAVPAWSAISDLKSSARFVAETAALGLAKSLAQSNAHQQQAKDQLRALAEKGEFVAVEAAGALTNLVATPEEKTSTKQLLDGVRGRFPSEEKYLSDLTDRLAM
jgi:predicted negative regulator of RcsB-dependent stress response